MHGANRLIGMLVYGTRRKPVRVKPWVRIRQQHMDDPAWVNRLHTWRQQFAALVEDARVTPCEPEPVRPEPHQPQGFYFYADGVLHDGYANMYDAQAALVVCANGGAREISDIAEAQ